MHTAFNPLGVGNMAKDYIIDYGSNSNGWYRKWKSGFIEQSGNNIVVGGAQNNATTIISLPIDFTNENYQVLCNMTNKGNVIYWAQGSYRCSARSINTFYIDRYNFEGTSGDVYFNWYACGY